MFLFQLVDLLALVGLYVQAFVAWIFIAVLATLVERRPSRRAYRTFLGAFTALALALTIVSVRFLRAHDEASSYDVWEDGQPLPTICYAGYMGLKGLFALLIVEGSHRLAGADEPRWLRRARWPLAALLAASALVFPDVGDLLVVQAPFVVACAVAALRALRPLPRDESGLRLLRASLFGLAATWTWHAAAVLAERGLGLHGLLSFHSVLDLAVQVTLGVGLVACLLQDAHRRALRAEVRRRELERELEKDEKLRALGTVVSGVAHELNNPLTVILGYARELRGSTPEGARMASIVSEQAERCHGIVRNLTALAGQSVHPREELDLEALAHRVARGLSADSTRGGRRVLVETMEGLHVSGDRIGLEQVLANLVENALQASPPGGTVAVRARRAARTAEEQREGGGALGGVELEVLDQGSGVPCELRERLFEPFFTTKEPGRGTGLGLSIARAIVRGHDGTIEAEDRRDGSGTIFRVRLPAAFPAPTPSAPAPSAPALPSRNGNAAPPVADGEPERAGRTLVVVDDDDAVRRVLRAHAERRGWTVLESPTAEEAWDGPLAEAPANCAVLCDLRMPGMGGIGLHDRLAVERPGLLERVVFVTGDRAAPEVAEFAARCTRPIASKPIDFEAVFGLVAELFAELSARR